MWVKKRIARPLVILLTVSQCMTAYGGTWVSHTPETWSYQKEDGSYQTGGWFCDEADKRWYYLDETGKMCVGWIYVDQSWYFLNTVHDGTFGAMLSGGWYWIDGYCYLFRSDGRLYTETVTPDGFYVDGDGRWSENGRAVYFSGKGISTKKQETVQSGSRGKTSHSSGGSGSGGGGGGSKGSSKSTNYDYIIRHIDEQGNILSLVTGSSGKNAWITIEAGTFEGHQFVDGAVGRQRVGSDHTVFSLYYRKIEGKAEEPASPDEDKDIQQEKKIYRYKIQYVERNGNVLGEIEGLGEVECEIEIPRREYFGYTIEAGQKTSFRLDLDGAVVKIYYTKEKPVDKGTPSNAEKESCRYTVTYVDRDTNSQIYKESSTGYQGSVVVPKISFDNYVYAANYEFTVKETDNLFTVYLVKEEAPDDQTEESYVVKCLDIAAMEEIERITLHGKVGEILDLSGICPEGYEIIGEPTQTVRISNYASDNMVSLYYKKIEKTPASVKQANYMIQFRAYGDPETVILEDITGVWTVGEKLPVYFIREITDSKGRKWEAIDSSPRIFTVRDQETNLFQIEFKQIGSQIDTDIRRKYSIRYVAQDTGSVLGIATGIGEIGDIIPYRNTFHDYGFAEDGNAYVITGEEDQSVQAAMKRIRFPGHEPNKNTGKYDGSQWIALFVDSNGEEVLPNVSGFTVDGDEFYIDYPETIEREGITYRAVEAPPYHQTAHGTAYRQIIIQYITGDSSERKLEQWKKKAQEKKDDFYGTSPRTYFLAYREKNSWNDIGLKFGVGSAASTIAIEAEEFDGWVIPSESLGTFSLNKNGQTETAWYERADRGTSVDYKKRNYMVHVTDSKGNDLTDTYTGQLAFKMGNSVCDFKIYYPNSFYDTEGNRWEAEETGPKSFQMSALDANEVYIKYHLAFENEKDHFVVESNQDVDRILKEFAVNTHDAEHHEFYLIGRGYHPGTAEVSSILYDYNLSGYTNEVVDRFELNKIPYTVSLVGYHRIWDQKTCTHEWEYVEELKGNCLTAAYRTLACSKCGKEMQTIYPAIGHTDEDHDSRCDVCGARLTQNLGDEIAVTWNSGILGHGKKEYHFVCIDTDYEATGKMLYICEEGIGSDIYGDYTTGDTADYASSSLRYFLDDRFASSLSIAGNLHDINGDAASILTKDEYDYYLAAGENRYAFPEGIYLAKGDDMEKAVLTDGRTISKEEADRYEIHPVLLLERSEENQLVRTGMWKEGDLQAREIGGKVYLFRCVDANYKDKSNTDKSLALFLCDTVIPSNEGLGFEEEGNTQSTRFFGGSNNYKYSLIHKWLTDNRTSSGDFVRVNVGVANEYAGSTEHGRYEKLDSRSLTRFARKTPQVLYTDLFIPSVEEALAVKEYLWKFHGSDTDNAAEVVNGYCGSYWLRTPKYQTEDMVYTVNLRTGTIEPRCVEETDGNQVCDIGIRPMYVVEQAY